MHLIPRQLSIILQDFSLRRCALTIASSLFFLAPMTSFGHDHHHLPDLGSPSSLILSAEEEKRIALTILEELNRSAKLSQDPVVSDYLRSIGTRIIASHRSDPKAYSFFVIKDKTINAFAVPGGMIGVNTGLIMATDSESELAGVLAHEIAHVHLKHIARFIEHMGRVRISNIAGVLASLILATQNSQAGSGALAATMAGSTQSLINFTRENEKEADFVGIHSLAAAGFDPRGMPQFFMTLSQNTRYYGNDIPEYLRTHPFTETRLREANERAQSYRYRQIPDSMQFHLIQARVKSMDFSSPQQAIAYYSSLLKKQTYRERQGALYGYALALIDARDPKALQITNELITLAPNQSLYQLAWAQALWSQKRKDEALAALKEAIASHPNDYAMALSLVEMQLQMGQTQEPIRLLHRLNLNRPHDASLHHLLSKAYSQANDQSASHRFEAESRYLIGDFLGAITHLKLAEKAKDAKHIESLQARRKDIERQVKNKKS